MFPEKACMNKPIHQCSTKHLSHSAFSTIHGSSEWVFLVIEFWTVCVGAVLPSLLRAKVVGLLSGWRPMTHTAGQNNKEQQAVWVDTVYKKASILPLLGLMSIFSRRYRLWRHCFQLSQGKVYSVLWRFANHLKENRCCQVERQRADAEWTTVLFAQEPVWHSKHSSALSCHSGLN